MGGTVMKMLLERADIDPAAIGEVIIGQVLSGGVGQAPARQAMRYAGLPDSVHAMTINKVCGSGLKAIMLGAGSIALGDSEVVIAGGMENMSMAPFILKKARYGYRMGHGRTARPDGLRWLAGPVHRQAYGRNCGCSRNAL